MRKNAAGVDCHKKTHSIVLLNSVGQVLAELTIAATKEGYRDAAAEVARFGTVVWGLESTGSYGNGFARFLNKAGAVVYEVPGSFTKRHRKQSSRRGKSDAIDAQAIAEAVLRDESRLFRFEVSIQQDALRLRYDQRDRLVRERTQVINRLRHAALRLGLTPVAPALMRDRGLDKLKRLAVATEPEDLIGEVLREDMLYAIEDVRRINSRVKGLEKTLRVLTRRLAPELLALRGVSAVTAAGLIGHAGNLRDCRDASAFAMRSGTAPVPCSSGRTEGFRLNVGGNRQLNRLLHVIALTQVRTAAHPGRLYYDRKRREGKTHLAAFRALKRQLATVTYHCLRACAPRVALPPDLRFAA